MTREEILQEAADAVAIEWIADERQFYPYRPKSMDRWISATNVLARFYVHNLDQEERHTVVYTLAPVAYARMLEMAES
jgi:hypothetical protein